MSILQTNFPEIINDNYKIVKIIGSGGMGDVYLAKDIKLDRFVALKTIKNSEKIENFDEYIHRFVNEAKSIAKLTHPNIIGIYDIGNINSIYYMAMEYIEGKNLNEIIKDNKLSLNTILKISKQICKAVAFIHDKGIIHRDIKTSNILVDNNYNIRLTDFGIAKKDDNALMLTQTGTILGSILYSPPEQFVNIKNLNEKSDLYSVGVCIYEMITGFQPFSDKETVQEIIMSIISENVKLPSFYSENYTKVFDNLLLKSLHKDSESRYSNMHEMLEEIYTIEKQIMLLDTPDDFSKALLRNTLKGEKVRDTRVTHSLELSNTRLNIKDFITYLHLDLQWFDKVLSKFEIIQDDFNFESLLKKIREKNINGRRFSGIVSNDKYYLFIYEGIIIGAFNIVNKKYADDVLNDISESEIFNKIINIDKEKNIIPLLYSILTFNGEKVESQLNSAKINIFELIDKLISEKFTGKLVCQQVRDQNHDKYVLIYNEGKLDLSIKLSENLGLILEDFSIEEFIEKGNINIDIYKPKFEIPKREIENLMSKAEFILKYKDEYEGKLSDIVALGKEEVSHCLAEAVKDNIYLDINLKSGINKINFLGNEISLLDHIKDNSYYRSCLWVVTEFLFLVNTSNNISYFKELYKSASEIKKFSILDELKGFYGCENSYSIIAKDSSDKIIFLSRFGSGKKEDVEIFIEETLLVKKNLIKNKKKELYSAFYISQNKIDNMALSYYYKNVKQEAGIFNKAKAYVKVNMTDGFNLLLLEENSDSISLIAPNLFEK